MYHFLHLIEGLLNTERLENKLRSRIMEIIGKTAKSKATGMTGIITGINGNKVSISFDGHASISVPVALLEIDEETMSAIESETTKTHTNFFLICIVFFYNIKPVRCLYQLFF